MRPTTISANFNLATIDNGVVFEGCTITSIATIDIAALIWVYDTCNSNRTSDNFSTLDSDGIVCDIFRWSASAFTITIGTINVRFDGLGASCVVYGNVVAIYAVD